MLAKALYYGLVPVLAPSNTPMNAELVDLMHRFDLVECSVVAPSILQEIAKTPSYLKSLQTLDVIAYGGGPLPREAGEIICSVTKLHNLMGGSEMFALATEMVDQKDWDYLRFSPMTGSELRHHSKGLWELYFVRQPALHLYQGIFSTFPELQEYNTNDLYSKHPTTPNLWRYSGRADDIITLTNGEKLNPTAMEDCINGHPDIESVLVVGQARFQTALLVEARNPPVTDYDREKLKDSLWPLMEQANKDCVAHGRLSKDLIVFTSHTKPFLRAGKGTIQQRMTVDSYESEINAIYDALEYLTAPKGQYTRPLLPWLRRLFIRLTGRNCLDDESDILASGMDSLQVLTAVREINSTVLNTDGIFKTPKITATVIYSNPTVEKLAKAIQKSMQSCDGNDPNLHEDPMQMQTMLSKYSRDMPNKRRPSTNPCSHASMYVLLTGSTGSLGSYLLKSLLDNPRVCKVYCLNRSIAAEKRQRRGHAICDWEQERVGFLHGDLSKSHLGLDVVLYRELLSTVTHVLHNAWEVNFNISFESFEKPHIYGVRQFIDFSSQSTKGAFIFFISSISAVMDWNLHHPGVVPERIISDFSAPAPMGYGRSKYVSELLLYNASKNAFVPSAICRVGQVAGPVEESHNHGIWNKHEWLPSLIASSKHLGKIPDSLGPNDAIDWIPVDILSRIIIQLLSASETPALRSGRYYTASTPPMPNGHSCNSCKTSQPAIEGEEVNPDITSPQVYHAVNPRHTTWANLLPAIHTYFSTPLETVSLRDWVGALAGSVLKGKDLDTNPAAKLLDIFQALVDEERQVAAVFETSQTKERSEALAGLEAVRVEWMGKWMEQWGF